MSGAPSFPSPRIRVAAIIVRGGCVLLVKHAKDGREYWMLPGGGVRGRETLHQALERELREEARIAIAPERLVLSNDSIAPDGSRHIVNLCFTARIVEGEPALGEDPRIVDMAFVPVAELAAIPMFPDFGAALAGIVRGGLGERPCEYLGNLWKP